MASNGSVTTTMTTDAKTEEKLELLLRTRSGQVTQGIQAAKENTERRVREKFRDGKTQIEINQRVAGANQPELVREVLVLAIIAQAAKEAFDEVVARGTLSEQELASVKKWVDEFRRDEPRSDSSSSSTSSSSSSSTSPSPAPGLWG